MSLKYKIAVVIFALEAIMMSFILVSTVNKSQEVYRQQFDINEKTLLNLLGDLSRVALFSHEYQELQPYIEHISLDPHVRKIVILGLENMVMTSSDLSHIGETKTEFNDTPDAYWRIQNITNATGSLGSVSIMFSNKEIHVAKKQIMLTGIKTAIIGMTLIAIAGFISGTLLTRRLSILINSAQRIKSGDLAVRSKLSGRDEISVLGQTFDDMTSSFEQTISTLNKRESELKSIRNELEFRVTERTEELSIANEELEHLANHDPLTGLANRSLLLVKLQQAITHCQQCNTKFALLMLDLDNFKLVNDTLGHDIGDALLVKVSKNLRSLIRKDDLVARLGGDEFCVILRDIGVDSAINISLKINNNIKSINHINQTDVNIGASIGIAIFPDHSTDYTKLMKHSDVAMYEAKKNGLEYVLYEPQFETSNITVLSREKLLINAIEDNELILHYQPKVDFSSGKLVGVEALVRWNLNGKLIYPDDFIPAAEKSGQIKLLTKWVLNAALEQLALWNRMDKELKMSINVSTKDLDDMNFGTNIADHIKKYDIHPQHLILEITETGVMSNPTRALNILHQLDQLGVEISIDDFGTGYSSLIYLKKMPVNELKIDRSFVLDLLTDSDSLVIVRSIVDLAHNLGITVTAEGVENKSMWDILSLLGCDVAQGYYIGKPMNCVDLEKSLFFQNNIANM